SIDTEQPGRVLEAQKDGVRFRSVASCFGSDAVLVLRPMLNRDQLAESLGRAFEHVDKPYDFDFDFTQSGSLVCTEVIYRAYEGPIEFKLTRRAGRMTLAAEELVDMARRGVGFEPVAGYCPGFGDQMADAGRVTEMLDWCREAGPS
ncbi:MAG: YiiX/YebB-like N1pC/P60 family cysteine hydrolase, partial [Phycisphaeraceae bacterium]|nr:YiiX/YebB-like N1pC/P60 family cysteine hydrolase [Phycisphaeraceae bacterium]